MYWQLLIPFFSLVILTSSLSTVQAGDETDKVGWWWYEIEPAPVEESSEKEEAMPSLSDFTIETLWNMHPDAFQELLTGIHKKAVKTLKEDDVKDYLVIQDIARRKALGYANVASMVVQKYPNFSLEADYPSNIPGQNAKTQQQISEINTTIGQSQDDFALIYFYSPSCHFCDAQNKILQLFQTKHPWTIRGINITNNPELAEDLGVHAVPYLVLLSKKTKKTLPIAAGVITLKELETRLHRGIRLLNDKIKPESFSMFDFEKGGGFDVTAPLKLTTGSLP